MIFFRLALQKGFYFFSVLFLSITSYAQNPVPDMGVVYKDDVVPRVDIQIAQELLDEILAPGNEQSDTEHPATFIFDNGEVRDTMEMVGFRLRGNTSRFAAKKSFKVAFDTFEKGRDYKGLEKLNLNGEQNDPSVIRSKLSWDLLRSVGVPAPRANHVDLYINGQYYGLYMNIEQIDEEFAEERYGNKEGNLYKCLWPADLDYRGPSGEDYKHTSNGRRVYDLKTNEEEENYDRLAEFIDIVNNTPSNDLRLELEAVFNVNSYLKNLAAEIIVGHWDGYSYLKNNYYLYENPANNKIEYVQFDMDNTYGIDWIGPDWGNRDLYNWKNDTEPRPLYDRMMENPTYRARLSYFISELLENHFKPEVINPKIDQIKALIQASAEADTFRPLDFGFSIDDFNNSYNVALGGHVDYGLKEYIQTRYTSAMNQLEDFELAPIIWPISNSNVIIGLPLTFSVKVEDDDDFDVVFHYQLNGEGFQSLTMSDDGLNGDEVAGDGIYSVQLDGLTAPTELLYHVTAEDVNMNLSRSPVSGNMTINISDVDAVPLLINEFMAINDNTIADEQGEFDDWLEIYNAGDQAVFLGDKFLTDNLSIPNKWQMPDVGINPGEVLLFWADGDDDQGPFHTNFRLSGDGEEIGIFYGPQFGFLEIHSIVYGPQVPDVSEGLFPDGEGAVQILAYPTPGRTNVVTGIQDDLFASSIKVWPNPASDFITIARDDGFQSAQFHLYSTSGQLIQADRRSGEEVKLDVSSLEAGVYVLRINQRDRVSSVRLLVW